MPKTSIEKMEGLSVKMPRIMLYAAHEAAKKLGVYSLAEFIRLSLIDFMRAVKNGEDVSVDYHKFVDSVAKYLNIDNDMLAELMQPKVFPFKITPSLREKLEKFRLEYLFTSLGELVRYAVMWKVMKVLFEEDEENG